MLGGRYTPLARVTLSEQGEVTLRAPEIRQQPQSASDAGVPARKSKEQYEEALRAAARKLR
jgi:hypothetical protein